MNATIEDLMARAPMTTRPHKSVGHVKGIMKKNRIQSVPVVDGDNHVLGIVTTSDMIDDGSNNTPVRIDLLRLVEDHRFVMKNPPTPPNKKPKRQ